MHVHDSCLHGPLRYKEQRLTVTKGATGGTGVGYGALSLGSLVVSALSTWLQVLPLVDGKPIIEPLVCLPVFWGSIVVSVLSLWHHHVLPLISDKPVVEARAWLPGLWGSLVFSAPPQLH